ncbi:YdhR family protein [uncultured Aquimarina sp.]|uniref:YdhR family protein n=1 Tax=uncultured Aquimarina sp. TaxID=575652 RepID=UPI0026354C27|nr:YdhR family protein [uncultured Aquimarina sp.]
MEEKAIVNVQFKSNLSQQRLQKISSNYMDTLENVEGLIRKYYYINTETKTIGGTYLFDNIKLARNYIRHFLVRGIGPRYGIIPDTLKMQTGIIQMEIEGKNTKYRSENQNSD